MPYCMYSIMLCFCALAMLTSEGLIPLFSSLYVIILDNYKTGYLLIFLVIVIRIISKFFLFLLLNTKLQGTLLMMVTWYTRQQFL